MKLGFRTPSLKKSLKARTTGKLKRQMKKAINPFYGKKGVGLATDPKKALYNKVYSKTTIGISDIHTTSKTNNSNIDINKLCVDLNSKCNNYREVICNTTSPKDFFDNYDNLINTLKVLQEYETKINWKEATPSSMLNETYAIKDKCIKNLIDSIYKQQNCNHLATYKILLKYMNELSEDNFNYLNSLKTENK